MFFAAFPRLFVVSRRLGNEMPKTFLFLLWARATPAATPASPAPAAIAGVLSFFAVEATALPAVFAPLTVASLAASTVLLSFDELAFVRCEDALGRLLRRDVPGLCERLRLERDFAGVRRFAGDLRPFDRLPELALDLLGVCRAM
jgi:hypothetical protein